MLLLLSFCTVNVSAADDIKVIIDITNVNLDVPPTIVNGRTLVPLRAIFEALGATVDWNDTTQTVTSEKDGTKISLTINSTAMYVNGQEKTLDVPATLIDSRTLVPVRAISEAFGLEVGWDGKNNIVSILSNTENFQMLYAKDSRSRVFAKSSAATQASHGWHTYPVTAVYSADGKETVVATAEVQTYLNDGYYAYPVKTLYAADGREIVVASTEVNAYLANGYLTEKPVLATETGDGTIDYSVYGNTDEEYLATISCAFFIKTLPDINSTSIHSVNAGYYEGAYLTILNLTSSQGGKPKKENVVLRLEANSSVTPLSGGQAYFNGSEGSKGGYNYQWAKDLVENKPENFKNFSSNSVKDAIMALVLKK